MEQILIQEETKALQAFDFGDLQVYVLTRRHNNNEIVLTKIVDRGTDKLKISSRKVE